VLVTLAAAYYVALVPMVLVYIHHVGVPPLLWKLLIWAPCLLVVSIAIGALIGVLFIEQSIAAPAATGMGILLAYAGFVPLQELLVAQGNGATRTGHLTLASPAVLLKNAFGFTLAVGSIPATTARTWISLLAVVFLALALTVWIFLHAQGVETWETTRSQRWIIALAIVLFVVLPVTLADTNYDKPAPHATNAPSIQRLFARAGSSLALTQPGGQPPARCCSTILNRDEWPPLGTDEAAHRDLLILLPVDAHRAATLTEKDTVVLADFANTTGDPVFDGTLRQGLSAQLEQSPFLNLLSDMRIAQTLALMGQPKDRRLTQDLAREVCQRTASAATIQGSVASLGSQYVLGLKAVNCRNGDLLAEEQVTASGKQYCASSKFSRRAR
jgi:hypothetical protein